jgi:hypothetical protein
VANSSTATAIVLRVFCGEPLDTTVMGVPVRIECVDRPSASEPGPVRVTPGETAKGWKPPDLISGGGGVVGIVQIDTGPRLDVDAVLESFRENRLQIDAAPLGPGGSASVLFQAHDGSYASLDKMVKE